MRVQRKNVSINNFQSHFLYADILDISIFYSLR